MALTIIHAGIGGWGTDWEVNALPAVKEVEVVAWVDAFEPTLAKARKTLKLPAGKCFASVTDACAAVDADAVLVTTPIRMHIPVVLEALAADKHVLVEKPFAGTVDEARKAVEAAEAAGRVLMVSQNYRQYPAPRKAADLVAAGELGPVNTVRVDFRKYANWGDASNRHYTFDHALLFDMAIHHFDNMRMILGEEPESVYTFRTDPTWSKFRDVASATVLVRFSSGATVSYRGSWVSTGVQTLWGGTWHIECERGEISFVSRAGDNRGSDGDALTVHPLNGEDRSVDLARPTFCGRSANLVAFAQAIASGTEPESSGRRNLGSVAVMTAAARSLDSGQVEAVERIDQ